MLEYRCLAENNLENLVKYFLETRRNAFEEEQIVMNVNTAYLESEDEFTSEYKSLCCNICYHKCINNHKKNKYEK